MQTVNNLLLDSTVAADGKWRNISNFVSFSVHGVNLENVVWIEISNDPNVMIDNSSNINAPSAPSLGQFQWEPPAGIATPPAGLVGQGTLYVKVTYVTKWGETLASAESSIAVANGSVLTEASPAADAAGFATGYNVYVSQSSNAESLQTIPAYVPANIGDAIPGYSYANAGAGYNYGNMGPIPLGQGFALINGARYSGIAPPAASTAGSVGVGVNAFNMWTGGAVGSSTGQEEAAIYSDSNNGNQVIWAPSCLFFNFLRVRKSNAAQTKETRVWLFGCNG